MKFVSTSFETIDVYFSNLLYLTVLDVVTWYHDWSILSMYLIYKLPVCTGGMSKQLQY